VSSCESYPSPLRDTIHGRFDALSPGLRALLQSGEFENRAAAIAAIVSAQDYKSAYLLAEAMSSTCARTRQRAADAIRNLTEELLAWRERGILSDQCADFSNCAERLGSVLQSVIKTWEAHLHTGALEAALWMMESVENVLFEKLDHLPNRIGHALETILSGPTDPRMAGFVLRALSHPHLKAAAMKAVARAHDARFLHALAGESWVLADPQSERGLQAVQFSSAMEHNVSTMEELNPQILAGMARLLWVGGASRDRTPSRFNAIDQQGKDAWKRALLWRLVADETPQSTQALALIASRAGDSRSQIAARECRRRQAREGVAMLQRSAVRQSPLSVALERFIEEQDRLAPGDRMELASQLKALGPEVVALLERKLDSPQPGERSAAIRAVRSLGCLPQILSHIHRCVHDADPLVRGAALEALREDESPTTMRLLREALHDPDPRVQATAIEVLERHGGPQAVQPIRSKLQSTHHRVRANAIKALWSVELNKATQELEKMLRDDAPEHRLSALWVVERLRAGPIVDRVAAMSRSDSDSRVRSRAKRVVQRFSIGERTGVAHAR